MKLLEAYRMSKENEDDIVSVLFKGTHYILNREPAKLMGDNIIPLMFVTLDGSTQLPAYAYRDDTFFPGNFNFNSHI
jgi:hypothetical protein